MILLQIVFDIYSNILSDLRPWVKSAYLTFTSLQMDLDLQHLKDSSTSQIW